MFCGPSEPCVTRGLGLGDRNTGGWGEGLRPRAPIPANPSRATDGDLGGSGAGACVLMTELARERCETMEFALEFARDRVRSPGNAWWYCEMTSSVTGDGG